MLLPWAKWAAPATSPTETDFSATPLMWMLPSPSVSRSSGLASSSSPATSSIALRASCAAITTALPARWVVRLAKVPVQWGPVSVSAVSTTMLS